MVYTLIDHRNDAITCLKLGSETIRLLVVVPWFMLSFENVMTSFLWSTRVHNMELKLWSICQITYRNALSSQDSRTEFSERCIFWINRDLRFSTFFIAILN